VQVTLREWNFNIVIGESLVNRTVELVMDTASVNWSLNPAQQLKIKTGLTKRSEANSRRRIRANFGVVCRDLLKSGNYVVDIRSVSDTD
jgi:hypothetical protein